MSSGPGTGLTSPGVDSSAEAVGSNHSGIRKVAASRTGTEKRKLWVMCAPLATHAIGQAVNACAASQHCRAAIRRGESSPGIGRAFLAGPAREILLAPRSA